MPTKTVKVKKKGVIVSIYVEKPSNRRKAIHHHYHVHNSIEHHQTGNNPKGQNRRAELLLSSHRLRESARSSSTASPFRSSLINVGGVQRKSKQNKAPRCPVNWKIFNLSFCRSLKSVQIKQINHKNNQTGPSIKSMIKNFQATKKKGFVSRFMSMLQKRR